MKKISTGLSDSDGNEIFVGDILKELGENIFEKIHGSWVKYRVKQKGLTPIMSYYTSEAGQILPEDYTGCILADRYDAKNFIFINNTLDLRPVDCRLLKVDE